MTGKSARKRLDVLLVERGLAESLPIAQAMILAGEIRVEGARANKAGTPIEETARLEVVGRTQKYASRGGFKLDGALTDFGIDPASRVCLDVGSSTGGFTDALLQRGAARVYAIDVNVDQLAWKLQQDKRVVRVERNARELRREDVGEPADIGVADVSFISAAKILRPTADMLKPGADFLVLVKPQFELPKKEVGPGGIVSDRALHQKAIAAVRAACDAAELEVVNVLPSRLAGAEGNQEYFLYARKKTVE
jgi:23S rRNA (cytidine1920-2'-O)/16S rRNA (cytidine1409-2'-O)-methyltransferase